jgi:hypothetical protein
MGALVREVLARTAGAGIPAVLSGIDLTSFTRSKLAPMVSGLFPAREREVVLRLLEKSVVFLTPANIVDVLRGEQFLHSAWDLANLYLGSLGAELLGDAAPRIVGLSEETRCYVSPEYFAESDRFADYVVHEAAHIFHNCKRKTLGLPSTRYREWLLEIDFKKRETFAYACEAYARVCELARAAADRLAPRGGARRRRDLQRRAGRPSGAAGHPPRSRGAAERVEGHPRALRATPAEDQGAGCPRATRGVGAIEAFAQHLTAIRGWQ